MDRFGLTGFGGSGGSACGELRKWALLGVGCLANLELRTAVKISPNEGFVRSKSWPVEEELEKLKLLGPVGVWFRLTGVDRGGIGVRGEAVSAEEPGLKAWRVLPRRAR